MFVFQLTMKEKEITEKDKEINQLKLASEMNKSKVCFKT